LVGRSPAGHHVGYGEADVLEPERAQRLEAENVADQRGQHVDDGALLEEIDGIGDERIEGLVVSRHVLDAVGAALVVLQIREQIGPHSGPGTRGGLGRDRRGGFFPGHPVLGCHLEAGQKVGVLRRVLRRPIGFGICLDACLIGLGGHRSSLLGVRVEDYRDGDI
jgi:hypothetical protein